MSLFFIILNETKKKLNEINKYNLKLRKNIYRNIETNYLK